MGTNTVKDLKQRYIDHLMSMDLEKMDMQELGQYSYIIKTLDDMERPGYAEMFNASMYALGKRDIAKEE